MSSMPICHIGTIIGRFLHSDIARPIPVKQVNDYLCVSSARAECFDKMLVHLCVDYVM